MRDSGDVVVIGAGLIGLAIAFELAERGASVRLYDRGEPGRGASWAGAGILAPYTEVLADDALLELCEASLREYPSFVDRVKEAAGVDPHLHLDGVLHVAFTGDQLEKLRAHSRALKARGVPNEVLDRAAALTAEAWLGPHTAGGLLVHEEGCVDNRRLGRALVSACEAKGVTIAHTAALRVECDERRVRGVATDLGFVAADTVVNACGAWAAELHGLPATCVPPVTPVKGQMFALAVPANLVHRTTWLPNAYLVPRDDGRLLIGATVEAAGFDERATAQGIESLLASALAAAPALGSFTITETWAGLRPGTPDERPFLGATPLDGFFLATGHYRNGILLAPVTARLLADSIEGRDVTALRPFLLARPHAEESRASRIIHA